MQSVIVDPGLEIKGYKRQPAITCPPSGLVINPAVGCVNVWNKTAEESGDIVRAYDPMQYPDAVVSDVMRAEGLRIARINGHAVPVTPVAEQPIKAAAFDAHSPFQATNFSV